MYQITSKILVEQGVSWHFGTLAQIVDRYLTTSDSDIFALGDCAKINGLGLRFVMPIMHAARALAKKASKENPQPCGIRPWRWLSRHPASRS